MQPFLDKLAEHLFERFGNGLGKQCIVFPNRRAGLFFRQYLSKRITTPVWLPDIYALEDFVVKKSGIAIADPLLLLVRLYEELGSVEHLRRKPFPEFLSWGQMILGDFDEIDQNLARGEKVFSYLDELKVLKSWNPDGGELTPMEKEYLQFYNSLAPLYSAFRSRLIKEGEGYFGLAFSSLLDNIDTVTFNEWENIFFAGFNALTKAEEKLIRHLSDAGKAQIFWDGDAYYLEDVQQEAGRYMRQYQKSNLFDLKEWVTDSLSGDAKDIRVFGVPGNVGQAKWAGFITSELIKSIDPSELAIILVDESLLLPVLNSMPPQLKHFNITMGYPLKMTPAYSLADAVFRLCLNAWKKTAETGPAGTSRQKIPLFHQQDISRLLDHEYLKPFSNRQKSAAERTYRNQGKIYYDPPGLRALIQHDFTGLQPVADLIGALDQLDPDSVVRITLEILDAVHKDRMARADSSSAFTTVDNEYLFRMVQLLQKISTVVLSSGFVNEPATLYELFTAQAGSIRIPFYGEPLRGLQVMGMLETRTLDFRNIIMLSVNEGLLPKGKHQNTFIPEEVRKEFGLQVYSDRNAVFAYHFYRLLQRGENITLLYNTEGDEIGGGEKSRFITQLLRELPPRNPSVKIREEILTLLPSLSAEKPLRISKTGNIMQNLQLMAEKGFSPTSVSTYITCSLQFCFSYLMALKEKELPDESIDAAKLGEAIHKVLQDAYTPYAGKRVTSDLLPGIRKFALQHLKESFETRFRELDLTSGKNLLISKVAEKFISRFFHAEESYLKSLPGNNRYLEILKLEEWLSSEIEITDPNKAGTQKIMLRGIADRIDSVNGVTRIIDYKTGMVQKSELKLKSVAALDEMKNPSKMIQLMMYALMYQKMNNSTAYSKEVMPGIISLRAASKYFMGIETGESGPGSKETMDLFESYLKEVFSEIYDHSIPFTQTENTDACKNCAYKIICNRVIV